MEQVGFTDCHADAHTADECSDTTETGKIAGIDRNAQRK